MISSETVCVVTSDGRIIAGKLEGVDQVQNLILNDANERVYSEDADVEIVPLGLYVIRGDNVCLVSDDTSEVDESLRIPFPLPSVQQQQF